MVWQLLPQEAQRVESAGLRSGVRYIAALRSDTKGRQPETRCRDAAQVICNRVKSVASVQHHACFRMGLGPKIFKTGLLDLVQKLLIRFGKRQRAIWVCNRRRPGSLSLRFEARQTAQAQGGEGKSSAGDLFDPCPARLFVWAQISLVHHLIIFGPRAEGSLCDLEGTKYGERRGQSVTETAAASLLDLKHFGR